MRGSWARQSLYVAMTRGREGNHAYVATGGDGDEHASIRPDRQNPPTPGEALEAILATDGAQTSARTHAREAVDPTLLLPVAVDRYTDAVHTAALSLIPQDLKERLAEHAESVHEGLTQQPAWETLHAHLALIHLAGEDPLAALQDAADSRELGSARDTSAVVGWRLGVTGNGPLPWLPGVPAALVQNDQWGPHLAARATQVRDHAAAVHAGAADSSAPWVAPYLDRSALVGDLAVWRAATGVPDADLSPTGPAHPAAAARRHQNRLDIRAGITDNDRTRPWRSMVHEQAPQVQADPWWPVLQRRLLHAERVGAPVTDLLRDHLAQGALPDEHPAAALWYRMVADLGPVTAATGNPTRPAWIEPVLTDLPDHVTERLLGDPHWEGFIAACHHSAATTRQGPGHLAATAAAVVDAAHVGAPDHPLTVTDLAAAMTWAVHDYTTDPTHPDNDETAPVADPDANPADDEISALLADIAATGARPTADAATPTRATEPPPEAEPDPETLAEPDPEPATSRDRIFALTTAADAYYRDQYHAADGPAAYLRDRLGTDLRDRPEWSIGYAPAGWTPLSDHLTQTTGATPTELVDAGLAKWTRRGTHIDVFRDRLMFGIHDPDGDLVGFVGRANPDAPDDGRTPKYLNTPATTVFTKGAVLFGLHEGAAPVRVEGPMDALAVTLTGTGHVGVAPLGTALTDAQADLLAATARTAAAHHDNHAPTPTVPDLLVITDPDTAGRKAARADYNKLAPGVRPVYPEDLSRLLLRDTIQHHGAPENRPDRDPAALARDHLLADLLTGEKRPWFQTFINDELATRQDDLIHNRAEDRVNVSRTLAAVIYTAPAGDWDDLITTAAHGLADTTADPDLTGHTETLYRALITHHAAVAPEPAAPTPEPATTTPRPAASTQIQRLRARLEDLQDAVDAIPTVAPIAEPQPNQPPANPDHDAPSIRPDNPRGPRI